MATDPWFAVPTALLDATVPLDPPATRSPTRRTSRCLAWGTPRIWSRRAGGGPQPPPNSSPPSGRPARFAPEPPYSPGKGLMRHAHPPSSPRFAEGPRRPRSAPASWWTTRPMGAAPSRMGCSPSCWMPRSGAVRLVRLGLRPPPRDTHPRTRPRREALGRLGAAAGIRCLLEARVPTVSATRGGRAQGCLGLRRSAARPACPDWNRRLSPHAPWQRLALTAARRGAWRKVGER